MMQLRNVIIKLGRCENRFRVMIAIYSWHSQIFAYRQLLNFRQIRGFGKFLISKSDGNILKMTHEQAHGSNRIENRFKFVAGLQRVLSQLQNQLLLVGIKLESKISINTGEYSVWDQYRLKIWTSPLYNVIIPQKRVLFGNDPRALIGLSALFTLFYPPKESSLDSQRGPIGLSGSLYLTYCLTFWPLRPYHLSCRRLNGRTGRDGRIYFP